MRTRVILIGLILLVAAVVLIAVTQPGNNAPNPVNWKRPVDEGSADIENQRDFPFLKQVSREGFVSSSNCRTCHPEQYKSWHASYHRTMTQVASPETIVAPFDDVTLESRGRRCHLSREGDEFWVTLADPDWEVRMTKEGLTLANVTDPPMIKRRIVMTTGSHHMQGYWINSGKGNLLRQIPWYFHIPEGRWIPREDAFLTPAAEDYDAGPEGGRHFKTWNDTCIHCHSVNGAPWIDPETEIASSEVVELGIACEACHGPGEAHIQFRSAAVASPNPGADPIVNPAALKPQVGSQVCGQCHVISGPKDFDQLTTEGYHYVAGEQLEDSYRVFSYDRAMADPELRVLANYFWRDGTPRVGGREYAGLVESPCYQGGEFSCFSCHSMHNSDPNDQLKAGMDGDRACLQCHTSFESRIAEHTHHQPDSSGSRCYNCHMPHTSFALLKSIRSHEVDSPRVASLRDVDRPNACNLCHLDRTLAWSAEKLSQWYGHAQVKLDADETETAASLLWLLRGDAMQRAVAAWHMNWQPAVDASGDTWQAPFLAEMLVDSYAAVRQLAYFALRDKPGCEDLQYDYVGPESQREQARRSAIEQWSKLPHGITGERARHLLLDPDSGAVQQPRLQATLDKRDDSLIVLPE